jgi:hypothetical protein
MIPFADLFSTQGGSEVTYAFDKERDGVVFRAETDL